MHVALIVDAERLAHEHLALNRLSIGLIGEGVQLTRIIPEDLDAETLDRGEQQIALAARLEAPMRVLRWMRRDRAERLKDAMVKGLPDVLYALGHDAWRLGLDLAQAFERPLALDVWSAGQLKDLPRGRAAHHVSAYIAPTRALADALRQRVDPGLVCTVPIGVALPTVPREILTDPERSIALAIVGSGRDVPAYRALLGGLSRVVRRMSQIQAFLELSGPNEHEIWRQASRLELLENVSAITEAAQHRSLLTRCDLLLLPEQFGELTSLMLEAMSFGMPVIASEDPFREMLIDGETACIVSRPDAEEWARQILRLLSEPETARAMGEVGREKISADHRSTRQIERLIETFQRIAAGGAYPFEPETGA